MQIPLRVVIAGHIDHGKSTLIGRLLYESQQLTAEKIQEIETLSTVGNLSYAYIMDSYQEEREENKTIDTTEVIFKTPKRPYILIDVPGHREYTKNMLTGASSAQAAIIVIDTTVGIETQTKHHILLNTILGIKDFIIVCNKMDLVNYDKTTFTKLQKQILEITKSLHINISHIIPIAAQNGENISKHSKAMPWYTGVTLFQALDQQQTVLHSKNEQLLFLVQATYPSQDQITVGQIYAGTLCLGQAVHVYPENIPAKIKELRFFQKQKKYAQAGENIGITLQNHQLPPRGSIITNRPSLQLRTTFTCLLYWFGDTALSKNTELTIHHATQKYTTILGAQLNPHEPVHIQLKTQIPIIAGLPQNSLLNRLFLEHDNLIQGFGIIQ